jgi:hypothetical protein
MNKGPLINVKSQQNLNQIRNRKNDIIRSRRRDERATTAIIGSNKKVHDLATYIYNDAEIEVFQMNEAINNHPLAYRPTNIRSKLAYSEIMKTLKPTSKYLLPGQCVVFEYMEPKFKEELEYYDKTPFVIFLGITRTDDGNIREVGLNLHYFPPHTRTKILNHTYQVFKPYFNKYFNEPSKKPNTFISYDALKHIMKNNTKIAFGIKMYIPVLRGSSYILPTRLLPTAFYTEGHFSKATLSQIFSFWRKFKK